MKSGQYINLTIIIMAKQTSLFGKVSGKLGAVVFSTSGGETISREYNPNVANPSTVAQVNQRSKMKLMSQLSASLAPVIAMPKTGLVSARNKFTKKNFNYTYASNGVAQVSYENLQLTEGQLSLPMIGGYIADGNLWLYFPTEPSANIARVVWCLFRKTEEEKLEFVTSGIATNRTPVQTDNHFFDWDTHIHQVSSTSEHTYVIFAYGMVDTSAKASTNYGNLAVETATDIATLVASRKISSTDYQFTQTRGATWVQGQPAPQYSGTSLDPNKVRIFVTATNGGSVSGGGAYDIGDEVTLTATANQGYSFVKWQYNGGGDYATRNPVTFTASEQMDLVAVFQVGGNDTL